MTIPTSVAAGTYYLGACADNTSLVAESNEANNCRASATTVQVTKPDLVVSALSDPPAAVIAGSSFNVTETTTNVGTIAAAASTTRYRLSLDSSITSSDPLLVGARHLPSLPGGASMSGTTSVTVPPTLAPGTYYLGACADDPGAVEELNETNNCRASTTAVTVRGRPTISSLSPGSGVANTSVTISGTDFGATQGTSTVTFNGVAAATSSWSDTAITALVPAGATTGPVVVTVAGHASNSVPFVVSDPAALSYIYDEFGRLRAVVDPVGETATSTYDAVGNLLSISRHLSSQTSIIEIPPRGAVGVPVIIQGTGFSATPSQNVVQFNGVTATVISATPTQIVAVVPASATTGPITVTTPSGSATSESFTIGGPAGAPIITGFSPTIGVWDFGPTVTVTGTNFDPTPGNDTVRFNLTPVRPTSATATSLVAAVPFGATSGRISVVTPSGQGTSAGDFFVPPAPYAPADVQVTGRVVLENARVITITTQDKIGLIVFDGTGGQWVSLWTTDVTIPSTYVALYHPNGSRITSTFVRTGGAVIADVTLPVTGTYTVLVDPDLPITSVAGNGTAGFSGDGGPAVSAQLNAPFGVAVDSQGNLFVADTSNHRIRKVTPGGTISTVAGTGTPGYGGDGGPAVSAQLNSPYGIAVDGQGTLFIADSTNHRVRKVAPDGTITTVAGTGVAGYSGDNGPATSAQLAFPLGLAVDAQGNLYIADTSNHRVRKVDAAGTISTVAGTGTFGYSGDNGPAVNAQLDSPSGVTVDSLRNLFIADSNNNRVRKVSLNGTITTVAGTGTPGYSGDGGPATSAQLNYPSGVAVDGQGDLFIADQGAG